MQSMPVLILFGVLMLFFAYSMVGLVGKMLDTAKNKNIALDKVAELEKSKEKLELDITKLNTNQGLEESIREKFGLVKEGESVIVIVDEKESKPELEANTGGFWSFFKNLFK